MSAAPIESNVNAADAGSVATAAAPLEEESITEFFGFDIAEFFTNKAYVLQRHTYERVSVEGWSLKPNVTDPDLTGQILWPGSEIIAYFLTTPFEVMCQRNVGFEQKLEQMFQQQQQQEASADKKECSCGLRPEEAECLCQNENKRLYESKDRHGRPICLFCSEVSSPSEVGEDVSLPLYTVGCHLMHRRNIIELGSGYGMLGLMMGRFAKSVTITDYKKEVIELMERNKIHALETSTNGPIDLPIDQKAPNTDANAQVNDSTALVGSTSIERQRRLRSDLHVEPLLWGVETDLPPLARSASAPSGPGAYELLVSGDIVYDSGVVPVLLGMISRYLDQSPHTLMIQSHITRRLSTDRAFNAGLEKHCMEAFYIPIETFLPQPLPLRFEYGNMMIITRKANQDAAATPAE